MLEKLRLENFKNFRNAELSIGPLTLLVGTNASGKSNIRDAFRFLHGVSRGYSLAEIIGEKWVEGGVLQWKGIRGGTREACFDGLSRFALEASFSIEDKSKLTNAAYRIEVDVGDNGKAPRVTAERLVVSGRGPYVFDTHPKGKTLNQYSDDHIAASVPSLGKGRPNDIDFNNTKPILSQVVENNLVKSPAARELVRISLQALSPMRFLDLSTDAMRVPSLPGQTILGDRGENLSSVLQAICKSSEQEQVLTQWVQELTPMDAERFEFPADQTGKILLTLIEKNGQRISAHSASDGTLRFLAMIAALLGPEPARFYFFEELENGLHSTRLHLLLQLIEKKVSEGKIQMAATTHSPYLLGLLSEKSLKHASLVYRLDGKSDARIKRILDIPNAKRLLKKKEDFASLLSAGWFEDAINFTDEPDNEK